MASFFAAPTLFLFLTAIPLGRLTSFPGSTLTAETVAKLVAAVN